MHITVNVTGLNHNVIGTFFRITIAWTKIIGASVRIMGHQATQQT